MCGICGIVGVSDRSSIELMTSTLSHRGPDDFGVKSFDSSGTALGHRRLSILDLSPLGHQPMTDTEGRYWLTYNGKIYDYLEIRNDLSAKGYRFKSNSDTEVIIYAYKEWGAECLQRMNGMFAFAIWDE